MRVERERERMAVRGREGAERERERAPSLHPPAALSPVSVAMSTTAPTLAPSPSPPALSWANQMASARMRRPSASVLLTSTVLPDAVARMSPGSREAGPMRFSQQAAIRWTVGPPAGRAAARASAAPRTAPAPAMSNFIISIMPPTFRL
jgi:hypothetical protein